MGSFLGFLEACFITHLTLKCLEPLRLVVPVGANNDPEHSIQSVFCRSPNLQVSGICAGKEIPVGHKTAHGNAVKIGRAVACQLVNW